VKTWIAERVKQIIHSMAIQQGFCSRRGTPILNFSDIGGDFERNPTDRVSAQRLWELYFGCFDRYNSLWQAELEKEVLDTFGWVYSNNADQLDLPVASTKKDLSQGKAGRPKKYTNLVRLINEQKGNVVHGKKKQHERRCGYYLVKSLDCKSREKNADKQPILYRTRPVCFIDEYLVGVVYPSHSTGPSRNRALKFYPLLGQAKHTMLAADSEQNSQACTVMMNGGEGSLAESAKVAADGDSRIGILDELLGLGQKKGYSSFLDNERMGSPSLVAVPTDLIIGSSFDDKPHTDSTTTSTLTMQEVLDEPTISSSTINEEGTTDPEEVCDAGKDMGLPIVQDGQSVARLQTMLNQSSIDSKKLLAELENLRHEKQKADKEWLEQMEALQSENHKLKSQNIRDVHNLEREHQNKEKAMQMEYRDQVSFLARSMSEKAKRGCGSNTNKTALKVCTCLFVVELYLYYLLLTCELIIFQRQKKTMDEPVEKLTSSDKEKSVSPNHGLNDYCTIH
jgi:hypothetical protein